MLYAMPGSEDALFTFKNRYENFIGGEWVAPLEGKYFENVTPVTGGVVCEVARSTPADLHKALDVIKQVNKGHDGRQRKVLYSTGVGCLVFKEKIENYVNARCVCN